MEDEINMIEVVKSRRYFKQALQLLLTKEKRLEIRQEADYYIVNSNEDDDSLASSMDEPTCRKVSQSSNQREPFEESEN